MCGVTVYAEGGLVYTQGEVIPEMKGACAYTVSTKAHTPTTLTVLIGSQGTVKQMASVVLAVDLFVCLCALTSLMFPRLKRRE